MASGGANDIKTTLRKFMERSTTDDTLKLTPFLKCIEACGLKQYKSNVETSVWGKYCDKSKKVTIDKIASTVIDAIAADIVQKKHSEKAPRDFGDDEVKAMADTIRTKIAARSDKDAVKAPKVDSTTARLTDTSGYTGSHKERFDDSGKGKGIEGRADRADNSGYVGNYKGQGTFDKK